jgi:hypothetical protein
VQRTRLHRTLGGAWPLFEQWAQNPWRRLSLLLIVLLGSFFLGNVISSLTGARSVLDPPAALVCVMLMELAIRARRPLKSRRDRLGLQLLDLGRIGFGYGLLIEGFKLL